MRLKQLRREDLDDNQRRILDEISEGPRGKNTPGRDRSQPSGLFGIMIRAPGLADPAQKVGAYLRYGSSLDMRISEMAIIITARFWNSDRVWNAHCPLALKAGLGRAAAEDLAHGRTPGALKEDEAAAHRYCKELLEKRDISDATLEAAKRVFGEQGVVDLTGVAGYYSLASMMQNLNYGAVPAGAPFTVPA